MWAAQCRANKPKRFLGQLGRLSPHGPPTPRSRCRFARPSVGEWHGHTPLGRCSAGIKGVGKRARFRGPFVARFGLGTSTSSKLRRIRDPRHQGRMATRSCLSSGTGISRVCGLPQFGRRRKSPREIPEREWCRLCPVHSSDAPFGPHRFPAFACALVSPPSAPASPRTALRVCGRSIDVYGHHRAACARAGVLARRGFALESTAACVCREAGAWVTTNVMVRHLDLGSSTCNTRVGLKSLPTAASPRSTAGGGHDHRLGSGLRRHSPSRGRKCRWGSSCCSQTKEGTNLPRAYCISQPMSFGRPCQRGGRTLVHGDAGVLEASSPG